MKKYITSAFLFASAFTGFSQARMFEGFYSNGMPGMKIPDTLKNINVTSPLYPVNDTTWGTHATDSLRISNDSVYARKDNNFIFQYKNSSAAAGWTLAGNSITAATDYFGTNNNTSVRFRTNNTQVAILDSNGRLGLGIALPLAKFHLVSNGIGITQLTTYAALFENQTAATSGLVQMSPRVILSGKTWRTDVLASQDVSFTLGVNPVASGAAIGNLLMGFSGNGAAVANIGTWNQAGTYTAEGNINSNLTSGDNTFASGFFMTNTGTGRYIRFNGGGGTIRAGIFHQQTLGDLDIRVGDATSSSTGILAMRFNQQNGDVQINTTTVSNDAQVNIVSTGKGVLFPRLTTLQRDSINLTVTGITVSNGGSGYTTNPTVTFSAAPTGWTTAVSNVPTRVGNAITAVTVATAGSYNATPTITVTGGGGSGAILFPVMTQVLTTGLTIFCTNCTATDASTGVMQTWNGTAWKNNW